MKKNRMMRLASVLLVLCLLTTSVISGTFAKYTTSASANDSARVAKWGVNVIVTADPFANSYAKTDNSYTVTTNTVVAATEGSDGNTTQDDVVAPGTDGTLGTIQITGVPEVATAVKTTVDVELSDGWKYVDANQASSLYFPLVIKVGNNTVTLPMDSIGNIEAAIEDAIIKAVLDNNVTIAADTTIATARTATKYYEPNDASLADANAITVTWEWPFEGEDTKDTYLGDNNEAATISVNISVSVTQVN